MKGFNANIEQATLENNNFRKVLYTGKHSQLVLMSLKPGEEIGMETHEENDQFFRFESGQGKCVIDGNEYTIGDGIAIVVPAGAQHNIINTSNLEELKLYTIYSPAHHQDGVIRATKEEAEADGPEFDGVTTEY
ncbi:cupin domain-containing protein [candidate division WWE3 bacterium CG08_land_8_20_14_0_20_43_13]|uniref:Cupin domain-containing protein n=1 Tax=candidate division WWE3 bacterium CG08_land_8_20_14_0_20_43_13 TaxID=1975087 RepID=A0A2H0X6Y3_UNCKA|nr:MAG: cupin domain-containing protein [candidate division WWE3 bacterium CG08_land_8_20_14_0_20_43_13]